MSSRTILEEFINLLHPFSIQGSLSLTRRTGTTSAKKQKTSSALSCVSTSRTDWPASEFHFHFHPHSKFTFTCHIGSPTLIRSHVTSPGHFHISLPILPLLLHPLSHVCQYQGRTGVRNMYFLVTFTFTTFPSPSFHFHSSPAHFHHLYIFTLLSCIVIFSTFIFLVLFQMVHVTFAFNFYNKYLRLWIFLAGPCLWCCVLFLTRKIFLVLSTWQTNWVATHLSCSDGKNFPTNSQIFSGCIFFFLLHTTVARRVLWGILVGFKAKSCKVSWSWTVADCRNALQQSAGSHHHHLLQIQMKIQIQIQIEIQMKIQMQI